MKTKNLDRFKAEEFATAYANRVSEDVINGAKYFFRNANLESEILKRYKTGIVLQEIGEVDVSELEGGVTMTVRYHVISSAHHFWRKSFAQYAAWTIPKGSYFKILDVNRTGPTTMITLLHLPAYTVPYFGSSSHPFEEAMVADSRLRFEKALDKAPIGSISEDYWRRRTAFPIGINDDGSYFFRFEGPLKDDFGLRPRARGILGRIFRRGKKRADAYESYF